MSYHHYRFLERKISCSHPLPELPAWDPPGEAVAEVTIALDSPQRDLSLEVDWYEFGETSSDESEIRYGCLPSGYLIRFPGTADFVVDIEHSHIDCLPSPEVAGDTLRHLLLDHVLPRMLGQQGSLILHASAADVGGKAIVILGKSGWGKSTLAASFPPRGCHFSDDATEIRAAAGGGFTAIGSYPGARLLPDSLERANGGEDWVATRMSRSAKFRLSTRENIDAVSGNVTLGAIVILEDPVERVQEDIELATIRPTDALMALMKFCYLLKPDDLPTTSRLWMMAGDIVRSGIPVRKLSYPREYAHLATVLSLLEECLGQPPGSSSSDQVEANGIPVQN
jgi:hypothetical protein